MLSDEEAAEIVRTYGAAGAAAAADAGQRYSGEDCATMAAEALKDAALGVCDTS
eukprot:COSAG05_NODE_21960_length_268_cov_0.609467_1_plen_53_part_10